SEQNMNGGCCLLVLLPSVPVQLQRGKTDRKGFYIGKDKCGSSIVVDFDQRDEDKTAANVLILGNYRTGQESSLKLLIALELPGGRKV
ncbi:MAG: hypothetical protein ACLRYD_16335, partial [Ruminococcus callidus]